MKTYARVQDGTVMEIIAPMQYDADSPAGVEPPWKQGDEIPIVARYNIALVDGSISTMVDITTTNPQPKSGWNYDGSNFSAPSTP